MAENISRDVDVNSIRKLTIAVWVLSTLIILHICISLFGAFFPRASAERIRISPCETATLPSIATQEDQYVGFHDWPIEKQIQKTSVIAIARYEKQDGKLKCVISEILKQTPDTKFFYKIGDEYRSGSRYMRDDITCGDGQVIFFTGSPASMRYSCSFEGDRIGGLGDMPFATLRDIIRKTK